MIQYHMLTVKPRQTLLIVASGALLVYTVQHSPIGGLCWVSVKVSPQIRCGSEKPQDPYLFRCTEPARYALSAIHRRYKFGGGSPHQLNPRASYTTEWCGACNNPYFVDSTTHCSSLSS